jgi:hypothetical protein
MELTAASTEIVAITTDMSASPVSAALAATAAQILADIKWESITSILSTAFRLVPKIQELAAVGTTGSAKFGLLVGIMEESLAVWATMAPENAAPAAEIKDHLHEILAPSITAMINAVNTGDINLVLGAAAGAAVGAVQVVKAAKGWKSAIKCCWM